MPLFGRAEVNTEVINEFMTNTILNITKTCLAQASNKVNYNVGYVAGNVEFTDENKVTQAAEAEIRCEQSNDLTAAVRSEMLNTIKQSAMTTDNNVFTGDLGIYSQTIANNYLLNKTVVSSDLKDVMKCVSLADNEYNANFGVVMKNFIVSNTIDQTARAQVSKCVQDTNWAQDISAKYNNSVDQSARSVGTVVGLAAEAGDILAKMMSAVIAVAVVGAVVYFAIKFSKKDKKKGAAGAKPGDKPVKQSGGGSFEELAQKALREKFLAVGGGSKGGAGNAGGLGSILAGDGQAGASSLLNALAGGGGGGGTKA